MGLIWQPKYRLDYKTIANDSNSLEIQIYAAPNTVTTECIVGKSDPVILKRKNNHISTTTLELSLVTNYDGQFLDLFTNDVFKYRVVHRRNGVTIFDGWLDTEMYSTEFNLVKGNVVKFYAVDGLSILKRLNFNLNINPDDPIINLHNLITSALNAANISYQYLYIGTDITIPNGTIEIQNSIISGIYVNQNNYIDNKGDAYNWYKVLEETLKPLNLYLTIAENNVFVYDREFLFNSNKWQKFNSSNVYVGEVNKTTYNFDTLGNRGKIMHSLIPSINYQKVTSNIYYKQILYKKEVKGDEMSGLLSTVNVDSVNNDDMYDYTEESYSNIADLSLGSYTSAKKYIGTENSSLKNKTECTIKSTASGLDGKVITFDNISFYCIGDSASNLAISVSFDWFAQSFPSNRYDVRKTNFKQINSLKIPLKVTVGNKRYVNTPSVGWIVDDENTYKLWQYNLMGEFVKMVDNLKYYDYSNKWYNTETEKQNCYLVPIPDNVNGRFNLSVIGTDLASYITTQSNWLNLESDFKGIDYKNFVISLVDKSTGLPVEVTDNVVEAYLDTNWKSAGSEEKLIFGTNTQKVPNAIGCFIYKNTNGYYKFLNSYTRNGITADIETQFLYSILSDRGNVKNELALSINTTNDLLAVEKMTYSKFSGVIFGVYESSIDYANNITNCKLIELQNNGYTLINQ